MGAVRPGFSQRAVLRLDASRLASGIASFVVAVTAGAVTAAALTYSSASWSEQWREDEVVSDQAFTIVAAVAGAICLLTLAAGFYEIHRWRMIREIERLSEDRRLGALLPRDELLPPTPRAQVIPPLHLEFVKARKMGKLKNLQRVTRERNVSGHPALSIVYLRLFDNQSRIRTFLEGAWREFGYVHLLRSADAVSPAEFKEAQRRGDLAGLFISDPHTMLRQINAAPTQPLPKGRHKLTEIAPEPIRVRDKYGSYPVRALLCHGTFWRQAVDLLLQRADLVVIDLSGFTDRNQGTLYELQRAIDRVPMEQVVFLSDPYSKDKFLAASVQHAWSQMAQNSPNSGMTPRSATIIETDHFHTSSSSDDSMDSTELVARPKESRVVAARAQDRLDASRRSGTR